jgi:hypothetical protein
VAGLIRPVTFWLIGNKMKLLIKELNPDLWGDLERLSGEKGAWGGCWCMYWRVEQGEKWAHVKGPEAA